MSPRPGPEPRIGDADREHAVQALSDHYVAGRLTKQEYDERSDSALAARTASDLGPLFADLPEAGASARMPLRAMAGPGPRSSPASTGGHGPHPSRPGSGRALPLLPILVLVAAVIAFASGAWWLVFVFGWLAFSRHGRCGGSGGRSRRW